MGDKHGLIPLSDAIKTKVDYVAVPSAFLGLFKTIPWNELAACAALVWTLIRICETETVRGWNQAVRAWFKRK